MYKYYKFKRMIGVCEIHTFWLKKELEFDKPLKILEVGERKYQSPLPIVNKCK